MFAMPSDRVMNLAGECRTSCSEPFLNCAPGGSESTFTKLQGSDSVRQMPGFGARRAQELAARGDVEEQVANLDERTGRAPRRAHRGLEPAFDAELDACRGVGTPRADHQAAHGRDAREGLAAEAIARELLQVGETSELAGRVAAQAKQRVLFRHAAAVVQHAEPRDAPAFHLDRAAGRARVQRVLQQLFQGARGALDDLASSDLAGELVG